MAPRCNTRGRCDSRHAPSRTHPRSGGPPAMQRSTSLQAAAIGRKTMGRSGAWRARLQHAGQASAGTGCVQVCHGGHKGMCLRRRHAHTRSQLHASLSRQAGRPPKAARARPPQPRQAAELPREGHNRAGASPCTSLSPAKEVDAHCGWPTLCAETWRPMSVPHANPRLQHQPRLVAGGWQCGPDGTGASHLPGICMASRRPQATLAAHRR